MNPDDICPRPDRSPPPDTRPLAPPIYPSAVYECVDPAQAERLLSGAELGYVYSRERHPNSVQLADKCRELHGADEAIVCGSGMAAMAVAALALVQQGDHVVVSNQLYGRSLQLFTVEAGRLGIEATVVDTCDLTATAGSMQPNTGLIVAETISNPLLRVADIAALAGIAESRGARLLVDNTFAGPTICRPLALGAHLVHESLTKIMNGHSDVLLGLLCGRADGWQRVHPVATIWGFSPSPFDCWLALRGLGTLALRAQRASANALRVAEYLQGRGDLKAIHYPGLPSHPDHALAARQFSGGFGSVVTFTLADGRKGAEAFMRASPDIPFSPSLGDLSTTLSHPESTSHRTISAEARAALGIEGGTIRLSVGIESPEHLLSALDRALTI
ncbi:MAG TPA: aminotransferase class I/II-fold pyridoxal phosphate-dependent enzyme [Pirellulales bacterium]|jgi:cystathionine beta-lyase/cystathionine gamma-synthase|nr:aminotransferase class I/II-fold pyridoxal phosphate-dependent enzyme [Pirellulales bacterium]